MFITEKKAYTGKLIYVSFDIYVRLCFCKNPFLIFLFFIFPNIIDNLVVVFWVGGFTFLRNCTIGLVFKLLKTCYRFMYNFKNVLTVHGQSLFFVLVLVTWLFNFKFRFFGFLIFYDLFTCNMILWTYLIWPILLNYYFCYFF